MKSFLGILAILLASVSMSFAQTADRSSDPNSDRANGPATTQTREEGTPNHNYGWIGLLGLAGLAGLRNRGQHPNQTERGEVTNIPRAA